MLIAVFVLVVFGYSLLSRRLERTVVTAPLVFSVAGVATFFLPAEVDSALDRRAFLLIAELGLVMTLFTDASHVRLGTLRENEALPLRLLSTGMLLTILAGAVAGVALLGGLTLWEAGILGAILAPTDAGLGEVIVHSPRVPPRVRQALNVEAGLNDGLSVPFLMLFIALAQGSTGEVTAVLMSYLGEQLGYGILVGALVGLAGGWLLQRADQRDAMAPALRQLGVVALPLLCTVASQAVGGSMFIAAFVAGLVVQVTFPEAGRHSGEFGEDWGRLFDFFVFFLFGLLVARAWPQFDVALVLYAVASLTVVRIVPVAVAVAGTGLSRATVVFMGWFGPRGLASIVLGLVYIEQEAHLPGEPLIRLAVMVTVALSIVAHGMSALPGINLYAARTATLAPHAPEHQGDAASAPPSAH